MDPESSSATPNDSHSHLLALPAELRIMIFERCLNSPPLRYTYLPNSSDDLSKRFKAVRDAPKRTHELRRHAMLLVNRQLSQEYTDTLYANTAFFFYIDARNADLPGFFHLAPKLPQRLRQCKLCVDGTAVDKKLLDAFDETLLGNVSDLSQTNPLLVKRVKHLLASMVRLSSLHLIWDYGMKRYSFLELPLGSEFLELLKGMPAMRSIRLTVARREWHLEKEEGVWISVEPKLPY